MNTCYDICYILNSQITIYLYNFLKCASKIVLDTESIILFQFDNSTFKITLVSKYHDLLSNMSCYCDVDETENQTKQLIFAISDREVLKLIDAMVRKKFEFLIF
jgi:hypothetical protein